MHEITIKILMMTLALLLLGSGCSKKNQSGATVDDSSGYKVIRFEDGSEYEMHRNQ